MEIKEYLKRTVESGASDFHLVVGSYPMMRLHGKLIPLENIFLDNETILNMVMSLLNDKQKEMLESQRDLDFSVSVEEKYRFRANAHYQRGTIAAAFRSIPRDIPSAESLMLPNIIYEFAKQPRGLILVTGPTGSGKSTTQAVLINIINNTRDRHIITVEDPIEFMHSNKKSLIEQREIGVDSPSFQSALKYVLRQDPDVILVGEMRDLESITAAITSAETGHLVISTLHTNDAVQTVDRIVDVFPPHQQNQVRLQLSMTLQGIMSQQLVERMDGKGLALASEVLNVNSGIRNIIRKGNTQELTSMIEIGAKQGMHTMDTSLLNLYKAGVISKEVALSKAINLEHLERIMSRF